MNRMVMKSKVNAHGVLHLSLPLGPEEAHKEVQITVESLMPRKPMSREEWHTWVDSMAGTWQGDFERPEQGALEERESL